MPLAGHTQAARPVGTSWERAPAGTPAVGRGPACLPVLLLHRQIGRKRGLLFLAYYTVYVVYLVLGAQQHDALDKFSAVMASFVLPITIVTLVAMVVQQQRSKPGPDG